MSFHYPRRVKDLPVLESESEDDGNSPCPPKKTMANKENVRGTSAAGGPAGTVGPTNSFSSLRMFPKRRAELPPLESDSEEESIKNDNLNCAILNDSFAVSPTKSDREEDSPDESPPGDAPHPAKTDDMSFLRDFNKMTLGGEQKDNNKSPFKTKTVAPVDELINKSLRRVQETVKVIPKDLETPFKSTINKETNALASDAKQSTMEEQFATPQIRSFSVQRRPRDLCSTHSQKTRSAIVNEFRSQKVLFQTPMVNSRPPLSSLPNDSISLSLCDTMNEAGTPSTAEKSPQRVGKGEGQVVNSRRSLGKAFVEAEYQAKPEGQDGSVPSSRSKENVLHINNADYAILQKLGCGGSSSVYLARRCDNGKEYALKVVDLHGDPAVVEGYLNETKLLAKLQGNVCVVALYEYQLLQKESKLFMVMEKGDSDLNKILQSYTTSLPLYVLTNFLYQMLQAVNYIHQNGVIHSDLKPANFLMVNGRLKLIDFGIASNIAIDSTSIIKYSQAGTFNYISPEALTDTSTGSSPMRNNQPKIKISTKSDVWSLGCILYLLLYKRTPFSHIKNIYAKISAISNPQYAIEYAALPPYYPPMFVHIVKHCLQHNPKQRPSCAELLKYPFSMIIPIQKLTVNQQQ